MGMLRLPGFISPQPGGGERSSHPAPRARHFSKSPRSANIGRRSWAFLAPSNFRVKQALHLSLYIHLAEEAFEFPGWFVPPLPSPSSPRPFSLPVQFRALFRSRRAPGVRGVRGFERPRCSPPLRSSKSAHWSCHAQFFPVCSFLRT